MEQDLFERLVQEEMERQLGEVKRRYAAERSPVETHSHFDREDWLPEKHLPSEFQTGREASGERKDNNNNNNNKENHEKNFPSVEQAFRAAQLETREDFPSNPFLPRERSLERDQFFTRGEGEREKRYSVLQRGDEREKEREGERERERGFGGGLKTLQLGYSAAELEAKRREEHEKKLEYQRALDLQLEQKKQEERERRERERRGGRESLSAFVGGLPLGGVEGLNPQEEERRRKEEERRKKEEYARTLEQQMQERQRQKEKERQEEEAFNRRFSLSSPTSPFPPSLSSPPTQSHHPYSPQQHPSEQREQREKEDMGGVGEVDKERVRFRFNRLDPAMQEQVVRKHLQQQQVQETLREQIEERKRRAEEEKRQEALREAADEARVQREIQEMQRAYQRDGQAKHNQGNKGTPSHAALSHSSFAKAPSLPMSPPLVHSSQKSVRERSEAGIQGEDVEQLASDIEWKREQVLRMRQEREALEQELERQRREIQQLLDLQKKLSPPPSLSPSSITSSGQQNCPPKQSEIFQNESDRYHRNMDKEPEWRRQREVDPVPSIFLSPQKLRGEEWEHATAKLSPTSFHKSQNKQTRTTRQHARARRLEEEEEEEEEQHINDPRGRVELELEFEQSMPSHSKLLPPSFPGFPTDLFQTTNPQPLASFSQHNNTFLQPKQGQLEKRVKEPEELDDKQLFEDSHEYDSDDPSLVERSLPCASRFFVYVSNATEHQGGAAQEEQVTIAEEGEESMRKEELQEQVARTPEPKRRGVGGKQGRQGKQENVWYESHHEQESPLPPSRQSSRPSFDSEDEDQQTLLNDLEQSRARTAQAARMALQRASAKSDDDEASSRGNKSESSSPSSLSSSTRAKQLKENKVAKWRVTSPASSARTPPSPALSSRASSLASSVSSSKSSSSSSLSSSSISSLSSSSSYSNASYQVSSRGKSKKDQRQPLPTLWGGASDVQLHSDQKKEVIGDKSAAVKTCTSKAGSQQKWEPFKVYRNVNAKGGALHALESATRKKKREASKRDDLEGDYSDDFSEDEYVAYGSEDDTAVAKKQQEPLLA